MQILIAGIGPQSVRSLRLEGCGQNCEATRIVHVQQSGPNQFIESMKSRSDLKRDQQLKLGKVRTGQITA